MSGVSMLQAGEKKGPLWKLQRLSFPGGTGVLSEGIKVSRYASFAAL